jgi:hypothetical protein
MASNDRAHHAPPASRVLAAVLVGALASLHAAPNAAAAQVDEVRASRQATASIAPCTIEIPPTQDVVDGAEQPEIGPGAVLCLPAGTRPNLRVVNLHGTADEPITIRNDGGPVIIEGTDFQAGIEVRATTYLRVSGAGAGTQCGALAEQSGQQCGIVLDGTNKGLLVLTKHGDVTGFEFDHLEIRDLSGTQARGIAIHPIPGQTVADVRIHSNAVSGTTAEGIYVGSEPGDRELDELGKVDRVEVANNLLRNIAWDAIKVKVALSQSAVHHNVIRDAGTADYERHRSGITLSLSACNVHHNVIEGTPEGIKSGRPMDGVQLAFHDNLIIDARDSAMEIFNLEALIANNTIVGGGGWGIKARGDGSKVIENIVAGHPDGIVQRKRIVIRDNVVDEIEAIGFVDPDDGDYSLARSSPAAAVSRRSRPIHCVHPGFKVLRPQTFAIDADGATGVDTCRLDLGAQLAAGVLTP